MTGVNSVDWENMSDDEQAEKKAILKQLESAREGKLPLALPKKPSTYEGIDPDIQKILYRAEADTHAVRQENLALFEENIDLKDASLTDKLTKLPNRRAFEDALPNAVARANRTNKNIYLIMMDMDYFKAVNDRYGHDNGDVVLKQLAKLLQRLCGENEKPFRWGGEEFTVILDAEDDDDARDFCERIRQEVEDHEFIISGKTILHKTMSIGFCSLAINTGKMAKDVPVSSRSADKTYEQRQSEIVQKLVDKALYAAKAGGRNTVVKVGEKKYRDFLRQVKLEQRNKIKQERVARNKPGNQV